MCNTYCKLHPYYSFFYNFAQPSTTYKRGEKPTMFENVKSHYAGKFISDGEWKHPSRINDSYEIIFITKGEAFINKAGTEYALGMNDILLIEPGARHFGHQISTNTEFFWLHWLAESNVLEGTHHITVENPYHITLYCRQLIEARMMNKPTELQDYLTRMILLELSINAKQPTTNTIAEQIKAWIRANSNVPLTTVQVANQFGYNADYINRLFKSSFQKTVKQYIDEERILYIKLLMLKYTLPLKQVATTCGFTDYKYFLKFFKYHEGITPTEFYKQFAKLNINSR